MEDEDCFGFGSYDEIFSRPASSSATPSSEDPDGLEPDGTLAGASPANDDVAAIDVGTHLLENGFFIIEDDVKFSTNDAAFHGRHIGLKIKQNGKLVTFNFPPQSTTAVKVCIDSNSRTHALGDLYLDSSELFWRPMRHSDTMQTSSGQVYGSDRYSLRIRLEHIHDVVPTKIQNVMLALSISISALDVSFEFSFMPGPYHKSSKRDDLMALLKDALPAAPTTKTAFAAPELPPIDALDAEAIALETKPDILSIPDIPLPPPPRPSRDRPHDTTQRNALVRTYLRLDPMSDQAIELATHVLQVYEYPIGPTSKSTPSFLDDKEYRQDQVSTLTRVMERMKMSWKVNDDRLDDLMHVRCSKNEDDDLVYCDTNSNKGISVKAYEHRYRQLIHQPAIILRSRAPQPKVVRQSIVLDRQALDPTRHFDLPPVPASLTGEAKAEAEQERRARMADMHESQRHLWQEFARLAHAHFEQVQSIREAYSKSMDTRTAKQRQPPVQTKTPKPSSRRRSMVPVPLDELKENDDGNTKKRKHPSTPTAEEAKSTRPARRRSTTPVGRGKGQSQDDDDVDIDTDLCNLCFGAACTMVLQPCLHSVCDKCWSKLAHHTSPASSTVQCPWDRQDVVPERIPR